AISRLLPATRSLQWENASDDQQLVAKTLAALKAPGQWKASQASAAPRRFETPGGAMPLDSAFYVVRPTDHEFQTAVAQRDSIILIRGARQMGKTSLLARG